MPCTAERRSRSPDQSVPAPVPIGVIAPTPVITTRRSATISLHRAPYARKRARSDTVDEHRADYPLGGGPPDQRPPRPVPFMHDRPLGALPEGHEPPFDVHPRSAPPHVPVPHS